MEVEQKTDIYQHWMAAHARMKNEFPEDEKNHNLMTWLNILFTGWFLSKWPELCGGVGRFLESLIKSASWNTF